MRRIGGMLFSGLLLVGVMASPGALAAASTARAVTPSDLSGGYVLHQDLTGHGYVRSLMTLLQNQTGYTDLDTIVWSRHGAEITLVFTNRQNSADQSTYVGALMPPRVRCSPRRIGSQRHPGTISGSQGESGTFYALNHSQSTC
jgi:hypothetical protein